MTVTDRLVSYSGIPKYAAYLGSMQTLVTVDHEPTVSSLCSRLKHRRHETTCWHALQG